MPITKNLESQSGWIVMIPFLQGFSISDLIYKYGKFRFSVYQDTRSMWVQQMSIGLQKQLMASLIISIIIIRAGPETYVASLHQGNDMNLESGFLVKSARARNENSLNESQVLTHEGCIIHCSVSFVVFIDACIL